MSLSNASEFNSLGGGTFGGAGFGFGGGWGGGIPPVGLFGIVDRDKHDHKGDDCNKTLFMMKSIQDAKDSLNEAIDSTRDNIDSRMDSLKDSLTNRVEDAKNQSILEGRALGMAICDAEKTNLQQFYAAAIQAANNTQAIKDQATAFAIVNDKRFDDLTLSGVTQTAAILARINQTEVDNLRDQLNRSHRHADAQDISIAISNSNAQVQGQLQAQAQVQGQRDFDHIRRFDSLFSQVAKSGQDIINVGGILAGVSQTANPVNVKS